MQKASKGKFSGKGNEFSELRTGAAIADLSGRRHGHIKVVIHTPTTTKLGMFRVQWVDGMEEIVFEEDILARYTTQSAQFVKGGA